MDNWLIKCIFCFTMLARIFLFYKNNITSNLKLSKSNLSPQYIACKCIFNF